MEYVIQRHDNNAHRPGWKDKYSYIDFDKARDHFTEIKRTSGKYLIWRLTERKEFVIDEFSTMGEV